MNGPMPMRAFVVLALAFAVGCEQEAAPEALPTEPPPAIRNVLLITLDTTRADALSCLGGGARTTPVIDALAERSVLFTDASSETNVTIPSHITLMTGLRAIEHGVHNNLGTGPAELDTLALALGRAGLTCAGFPAAVHLARVPEWRGFAELEEPPQATQRAPAITDRVLAWLGDHDREPFFVWAHYFDPHVPYEPPRRIAETFYEGNPRAGEGPLIADEPFFDRTPAARSWLGKVRDRAWPRAMYAGEVHFTDRAVGRLLDALEQRGLMDDTLIVMTADHGESLGEHDIHYDHMGLYEPQLRVPLLVYAPGLEPGIVETPVSTLDVAPTIAALMGVELQHAVSGLSLVPLLEGRTPAAFAERPLISENASNHAVSIRRGPWKLIWPVNTEHPVLAAEPQLFDLATDPAELTNLAAEFPERVTELRALLEPWITLGPRPTATMSDPEMLEQLRALGYTED